MDRVIHDVTGIGPAAAKLLAEYNINTAADLARASLEHVVAIPGFSTIRATRVIAAAAELLTSPVTASQKQPGATDKPDGRKNNGKKAKGKKKDKKGKKGKGKGKGKGNKKNKKKKKGKK